MTDRSVYLMAINTKTITFSERMPPKLVFSLWSTTLAGRILSVPCNLSLLADLGVVRFSNDNPLNPPPPPPAKYPCQRNYLAYKELDYSLPAQFAVEDSLVNLLAHKSSVCLKMHETFVNHSASSDLQNLI